MMAPTSATAISGNVAADDLISSFVDYCGSYLRLRPSTLTAYAADVTSLANWLARNQAGLSIAKVTHENLRVYLQLQAHLSNSTIARRINGLRAFYRFLVETGRLTEDPTLKLRAPRVNRPIVSHVSDNDLRELLVVCRGTQESAMLLTLAHGGLRRGELISLTVNAVDLDARRLLIREAKGGKQRVIPLVEELVLALRAHLMSRPKSATEALFVNRVGKHLTQTSLQRAFQRWVRDAGLQDRGYSLHSLRHGAATRWLRAGLNIRDVQVLLGHESIETTARYLHSNMDLIATELQTKAPSISESPPSAPTQVLTDDVKAGLALLGRLAQLGQLPAALPAPIPIETHAEEAPR